MPSIETPLLACNVIFVVGCIFRFVFRFHRKSLSAMTWASSPPPKKQLHPLSRDVQNKSQNMSLPLKPQANYCLTPGLESTNY